MKLRVGVFFGGKSTEHEISCITAIQGMLPHNKLGDQMRGHLYVYEGAEHPHAAQKPMELK